MNLEFRESLLLLLTLLAIPAFFLLRHSGGRVRFSALKLLPRARTSLRARFIWVPDLFIALAIAGFAVAIAGPRIPGGETRVQREGIAIMMVLDRSGSMAALDLSPEHEEKTRLDVVKERFAEFVLGREGDEQHSAIEGRPDDAIGLVSFARYADSSCPLTLDHSSLISIAEDVELVEVKSEDGTALGDALGLAVSRLKDVEVASKVIILLTDGVSNQGEDTPIEAAKLAKKLGIKVYTIGAGTQGLATIRVEDPRSGRSRLTQIAVEVDEETLNEIAEITNGAYFRATDGQSLAEVYASIDSLEKSRIVEERVVEFEEYFEEVTAASMSVALLGLFLSAALFRRLP